MTNHANELRRHAGKLGRNPSNTPAVMRAAADYIDELERRLSEAEARVAAPVRPNDSELEMSARSHGTGGWQTLGDMVTFARETAVLRANGFDIQPTSGGD